MKSEAAMTDQERQAKWDAENDARTLADAEVIRNDEKRLGKAQEAAKRLAEEAQEHADAMRLAAKGMIPYDKSPEPPKRG